MRKSWLFPTPISSNTSEGTHPGSDEYSPHGKQGWDEERDDYTCRDGEFIEAPHKSANIRDLDEIKRAPRNKIRYIAG